MPAETDENAPQVVHLQARLDARKRRDNVLIAKLRQTSFFNQLVKRFVEGQSVTQVATWVYYLKPEGPLKNATYRTIRHYLTPLRARVRDEVADHLQKRHEKAVREVHEEVAQTIQEAPLPPLPHPTDPITRRVDKLVRAIDSMTGLKYALIVQIGRIEEMRSVEKRNGMLVPNGYKEVELAKNIADSMRKHEVGEEIIRNKNLYNTLMPAAGTITPQDDDLAIFAKMDAVDRNLTRVAAELVIDMVREGIGGGLKAGGLGAKSGAADAAQSGSAQPTDRANVP